MTCPHPTVVAYELSPDLAAEKGAMFLMVCEECGQTEYVKSLPPGAELKTPTRGNA